jgi:hypothetical protein
MQGSPHLTYSLSWTIAVVVVIAYPPLMYSMWQNVSNASVMQVAERCPALQSLGLDQCQSISDEAILSLSKRCGSTLLLLAVCVTMW